MLKAAREAKVHTSWTNVNEEYESALHHFVSELLASPGRNPFIADFAPFAARIARIGMFNSLSQVAIKIASPGVPDFYQGNELWDFSLVDPDNRRPVDYARRRDMLETLKTRFACGLRDQSERARQLLDHMEDGAIKLYVTWKGLALRQQLRGLFTHGDYLPLETRGEHADRVCVFERVLAEQGVIVVAPRLTGQLIVSYGAPLGSLAWADTAIAVPEPLAGSYCNIYTQERFSTDAAGELALADVLRVFPVAILSRTYDD
jgi:(1->4)-alpha-D-glucan 1-alpha-D-glucosylmutase